MSTRVGFLIGTATIATMFAAVPSFAQTKVATAADSTADETPDDIVVTGSRGRPRTITDSSAPIDVLSGQEIQSQARPGVLAALNQLVPSFSVPARAGGGTASIIQTGGLRGLNPDQTLILVNGKRRHKSTLINAVSSLYKGSVPADLNFIPGASIERIEVLRDGAAAQYGSDAIAGVINIILRGGTEGGSAQFTAGQNFDRSDGETYQGQASYGMRLGDRGFLTLSANLSKQEQSNRALQIAPTIRLYPLINGQPDPREATIDRLVTKTFGAYPVRSAVLAYNVELDLGGDAELYSFGTYGLRNAELGFTFRAPNNVNTITEIYPNGYRPRFFIDEEDYEFAVGIRGTVAGWQANLSSTYGRNRADQSATETVNASLGPASPTSFYVGRLTSTEWVNSLDFTRALGANDAFQLSTGFQHRRETYAVSRGDPASYAAGTYVGPLGRPAPGGQAAAGFQPSDEGSIARNNFAAYGEVLFEPSKRFSIGAALRFEHYDDATGNTLIGKATSRFAATDWLAIRGTVSTGFRAPSLAQQIYASTTGQFRNVGNPPVLSLLQIKTLPVASPAAVALGSVPLKPEKATNFSAGIVLTPAPAISVTIDAYQIEVKDRIALTSTLTGAPVSAILVRAGLSPDISAQYFTNAIDTRTRGVDIVATARIDAGSLGDLRVNVGYNWNETTITGVIPNPAQLSTLGAGFVLFDRSSRGFLTDGAPKERVSAGAVLNSGATSVSLRLAYYGRFDVLDNATILDRSYSAKVITDLESSWQVTPALSLAIGANNLFNVYPDAVGVYNANLGQGQYSTLGGYGFTGGSYYAKIGVKF